MWRARHLLECADFYLPNLIYSGEIENISNKTQRNETRQYLQRVSIRCHQDGIFEVNVNATTMEIVFLEVVGNALVVDIKKLGDDLNKVLKGEWFAMQ